MQRLLTGRMVLELFALLVIGMCSFGNPALAQTAPANTASAPGGVADYRLDTGDKVKVTVYGEDDLSGEFSVDGSGNMSLPMIGALPAAGLTLSQLSDTLQKLLVAKKYLVNPRINMEVTNYRPFTILGEVNRPGEYPYENGMTALNAVALAGGFTYRADQTVVFVRRKGTPREQQLPADDRTRILPGDTIRVEERIF